MTQKTKLEDKRMVYINSEDEETYYFKEEDIKQAIKNVEERMKLELMQKQVNIIHTHQIIDTILDEEIGKKGGRLR